MTESDELHPKRQAILRAAGEVFVRNGYVGTSMDEIASTAAVSKQTVYKHFSDKERLFTVLLETRIREVSDLVHDEVLALRESSDVAADLRDLGRSLLAKVMRPEVLQLRRLVIGEAVRFPALGKVFYDLGPGRTLDVLAKAFAELSRRGALQIPSPVVAAEHFNWLVIATPLNRAMLLGQDTPPSAVELRQHADAGTAAFLAVYRRGAHASGSMEHDPVR